MAQICRADPADKNKAVAADGLFLRKRPSEFAHHDFIEKTGLKKDSADHPEQKNGERGEPWPPAKPRAL